MRTSLMLLLFIPITCVQVPCEAQSFLDSMSVRGLSAGAGAGAAAGLAGGAKGLYKNGAALKSSAELSKEIDENLQAASNAEKRSDLATSESALRNALALVARRDGPGSVKSLPILERLVSVTKEQSKVDDAIGFQKTLLTFAEADKKHPEAVVRATRQMADLYLSGNDLEYAETLAKKSIDLGDSTASTPPQERVAARKTYALILREMNRDAEADKVEAAANSIPEPKAAATP